MQGKMRIATRTLITTTYQQVFNISYRYTISSSPRSVHCSTSSVTNVCENFVFFQDCLRSCKYTLLGMVYIWTLSHFPLLTSYFLLRFCSGPIFPRVPSLFSLGSLQPPSPFPASPKFSVSQILNSQSFPCVVPFISFLWLQLVPSESFKQFFLYFIWLIMK